MELERVDVEDLGEAHRHLSERLGERPRVGVDEHERAPGVGQDRRQSELVCIEARLPVRARRCAQASLEAVRPGVVRALQGLPPTGSTGNDMSAMSAYVEERT
jgi:hypothetical protein